MSRVSSRAAEPVSTKGILHESAPPEKVTTVVKHVLSRLKDIGITKIFGVPGDYAFAVEDAIGRSDHAGRITTSVLIVG